MGKTCGRLPGPIEIFNGPFYVAEVGPEPVSARPLSIGEVVDNPALGSVYLESWGLSSCVYGIRRPDPDVDPFRPHRIFDEASWKRGLAFGVPTQLNMPSPGRPVDGAVYDPSAGLFYARGAGGLGGVGLYLIGDAGNFLRAVSSVERFSETMVRAAKGDLRALLSILPSREDGDPAVLEAGPAEIARALAGFLVWLRGFDPDLHAEVAPRLLIVARPEEPSDLERLLCGRRLPDSLYAAYDSHTGRIALLPKGLQAVLSGDYEALAQVLAHERGHQVSLARGWAMPSQQLMARAASRFLEKISEEIAGGEMLTALFGGVAREALICRLLPEIPEEEAQALSRELAYAEARGLDTEALREEAAAFESHLWKEASSRFPAEWMSLSLQYYFSSRTD